MKNDIKATKMTQSKGLSQPTLRKLCGWAVVSVLLMAAPSAFAVQFTTLAKFNGVDGSFPYAGLVRDSAGNLYGTTFEGGTGGMGTVYKLAPPAAGQTAWTQTVLADFNGANGSFPKVSLIIDPAGNLYGTTSLGGAGSFGTVFRVKPPAAGKTAWTLTTLANFNGTNGTGAAPYAGLIRDSAGNLYGTTAGGGTGSDGIVFKLAPPAAGKTAWTLTTLVNFNGTNGSVPVAGLVSDSAGNLYGTTSEGGTSGDGTVFRLKPPAAGTTAWTRTTLLNFNGTNGSTPFARLIFDSAGNLYGTTTAGGTGGDGTVFRLAPPAAGKTAWTLTTLVNFKGTNGASPQSGLARDSAGNLYGTTLTGAVGSVGTIFKLAPPAAGKTAWTLTTLVSFNYLNGATSYSDLILDTSGNLYGTTFLGGDGLGTIFKLKP